MINNIKPLRRNLEDLQMFFKRAQDALIHPPESSNSLTVEDKTVFHDLVEEVESLLDGIEDGARRTSELANGLRSFSPRDKNKLVFYDVSEGIRSSLTLLETRSNHAVNIVQTFDDQYTVECYPGKLKQVFMNLLANAIDAVLEKQQMEPQYSPTIWVTTEWQNNRLLARIKDNGIGMSEEVRKRMFDSFYTTKEANDGLGLGMHIVHDILESHRADLTVTSQEGKGTTVTLSLARELNKHQSG